MSETFELTIEVDCEECGKKLDTSSDTNRNGEHSITVTPCATCLAKAKTEGRDEGDEAGYARGVEDGKEAAS